MRRRAGKIDGLSCRQRIKVWVVHKQKRIFPNRITPSTLHLRMLVHVHMRQTDCTVIANRLTVLAKIRSSSYPSTTLCICDGTMVLWYRTQSRPNVHGRTSCVSNTGHENLTIVEKRRTKIIKTGSRSFVHGIKNNLAVIGEAFIEVHRHSGVSSTISNKQFSIDSHHTVESIQDKAILVIKGEVNFWTDKKIVIVICPANNVGILRNGN